MYCKTILNRVHKDVKCMLYRLIHNIKLQRVNKEYYTIFIINEKGVVKGEGLNGNMYTLYNYRVDMLTHGKIYHNVYAKNGRLWYYEVTDKVLPKYCINYR